MQDASSLARAVSLELLPYHAALRDFLKQSDPDVWSWFASRRRSAKYADDVRFDLLKSTYRVEREAQPALYAVSEEAAARLGVAAPITIYQAQNPVGLNASLAYVPGEIHMVLHGAVGAQLSADELRALASHELAHYRLLDGWNGEMLVASEMLSALANDPHAHAAHLASLRLFHLYAEIFCDRAALSVVDDLKCVVGMLVKIETGVQDVSPEAYLKQADEIFTREAATTDGVTHPEAFIRARAARLWHEEHRDAEAEVAKMIEGRPEMEQLDLIEQTRVTAATRRLIDALVCRKWFQSDVVIAHARLFFDDYAPPAELLVDADLARAVRVDRDSMRDYFCFVMLDFVTADRELDEPPLAAALVLAEQLDIKPRFIELARKELKLRKNQLDRVDQNKHEILTAADRAAVTAE